jgi:hypothetical protein
VEHKVFILKVVGSSLTFYVLICIFFVYLFCNALFFSLSSYFFFPVTDRNSSTSSCPALVCIVFLSYNKRRDSNTEEKNIPPSRAFFSFTIQIPNFQNQIRQRKKRNFQKS